jgi:Dolichyl-phosphate-mannose-protein mannosyltransferase
MIAKLTNTRHWLIPLALTIALFVAHQWIFIPSEPYFNNDETRHLMTGVFFHDFFRDLPFQHIREYTVNYYLKYPALGLIIWPPLFYILEGLGMLVFGTSFEMARFLLLVFSGITVGYLYLLVKRSHDIFAATLAGLFLIFSPLFFQYSSHVMLEVPTMAFSLAAIYYFQLFLDVGRRRHVYFASLACAFALLTRFDALFLFPALVLMALFRKQFRVLFQKDTLLAFFLGVILIAPAYVITAIQFGHVHTQSVRSATGVEGTHFLGLTNFMYYPKVIPSQLGWPLTLLVIGGALVVLLSSAFRKVIPYSAIVLGTYITFSPMAEMEPRHALYWVPALTALAAIGISFLVNTRLKLVGYGLAVLVLVSTAYGTLTRKTNYVRGYQEAAGYVLAHTRTSAYCLFDNYLNGGFIYQMRSQDPGGRLGVLRGDKLFYAVISDANMAYKEFAQGKEDILSGIYNYDPEYIVVEEPQIGKPLPMATLLRKVLRDSTERFQLEETVPLVTNHFSYQGVSLLIYRNKLRNPKPSRLESLEMLGLGHKITGSGVGMPKSEDK